MTKNERDLLLRIGCATIMMMEKFNLDPCLVREANEAVFNDAVAEGQKPTFPPLRGR